jgi:Ca2+-binding EF-hand superfamily protein
MRVKLLLLAVFALLFLSTSDGLTQYGGPADPRGAPGPRPGGGRGRDPNQFFNQMTNGKDVWIRSELKDPWMQGMFDRQAERMGITNGQITREQFLAYQAERSARGGGGPGNSPSDGPGGRRADNTPEAMFLSLDKNGDGYLNNDEMPEQLRNELERWDTDRNRLIDLSEFKAYFQARVQPAPTNPAGSNPSWSGPLGNYTWETAPAEQERKPPVVYRPGKLPRELPAWFAQLDTDQDGQIGLYEWKASGKSLQEFDEMDRNKDGFLTVDEVLRFVNKGNPPAGQAQVAQQNYGAYGFGQQNGGPNGGDNGFNRGNWNRGGGPGGPRDRGGRNFGGPRGGRGGRPRGGGNFGEGD